MIICEKFDLDSTVWKWDDGSALDYTFWTPGEPNSGDDSNFCAYCSPSPNQPNLLCFNLIVVDHLVLAHFAGHVFTTGNWDADFSFLMSGKCMLTPPHVVFLQQTPS
jgi:hypothetical protein